MKYSEILNEVSQRFSIDISDQITDIDIEEVAFVENNINSSPHTLYFSYHEIKKVPPQYITTKEALTNTSTDNKNIAVINQSDFFSIFNFVQNLIKTHKKTSFFEELAEIFQETNDLQLILDLASSKLNNPIVFIDKTFKIISHSTNSPILDQLFQKYTQQGYCDFNLIRNQNQFQLLQNMDSDNKVYVDKGCLHSQSKKLFFKVSSRGTEIGLVIMLCEQSVITETHYKNFKKLGKFLSNFSNKFSDRNDVHISTCEQIINYLLMGANENEIRPYLKSLTPSPYVCTIVTSHKRKKLNTSAHKNLRHELKNTFPNIHLVNHNNKLVIFFELDETGTISKHELQLFYDFAKSNSLIIGISNTYSKISDFVEHYHQACTAIKFQQIFSKDSTISHYNEYQFYHLLSSLKDTKSLENFRHPALKLLQLYDAENNTSLYYTLKTLLKNSMNIKETASDLFIHRNSLNYRIERIKIITNIDLRNSESNFLLIASFHIDKFMKYNSRK
jgi:hypothetical protein